MPNHTIKAADLREAVLFCITSYFSYRQRDRHREIRAERDRERKDALVLINKNNGSENVQVHSVSQLPESFMVTTLYNKMLIIS